MLITASTTPPTSVRCVTSTQAEATVALTVAIDDARAHLDAVLTELHQLVAAGELEFGEAEALGAEYAEVYLGRLAALEQLGALACTPDEWQDL